MKLTHRHAEARERVFEGEDGWRAYLTPVDGSGPAPGCGLLPSWELVVFHCDIERFRESYVDRPGAVEDAERDARDYMAYRLPAWRREVEGGLQIEDLDLLARCAICEAQRGTVAALWDDRKVQVCRSCFRYETGE